jgi:hypothetical protein
MRQQRSGTNRPWEAEPGAPPRFHVTKDQGQSDGVIWPPRDLLAGGRRRPRRGTITSAPVARATRGETTEDPACPVCGLARLWGRDDRASKRETREKAPDFKVSQQAEGPWVAGLLLGVIGPRESARRRNARRVD